MIDDRAAARRSEPHLAALPLEETSPSGPTTFPAVGTHPQSAPSPGFPKGIGRGVMRPLSVRGAPTFTRERHCDFTMS